MNGDSIYDELEDLSDFAALLSPELLDLAELSLALPESPPDAPVAPLLESPLTFLRPPLLKSVSYQPPPFKRNPAADIFLIRLSLLQLGQAVSGASLIFCIVSNSCSQSVH